MAEKFDTGSLSKKEIASQLRKPKGEGGKAIGKEMNKGNKYICLNSYSLLNPQPNSLVLEIGMGNGLFIKDLLSLAGNLKYIGVDYSQTMVDEASIINKEFIDQQRVSFITGSVARLPFQDNSVDYVTTTNTIYFWPDLKENAKEIHRILKPHGKILVGYRSRELMDKIELTKYGFNKYTKMDIENA